MTTLPEKVLLLERAFDDVEHAFGGALALAYYAEPRGTIDIDLNLFVATDQFDAVSTRLTGLGVAVTAKDRDLIVRDGQGRVLWDATPLDLFFAYDDFHFAAARARRQVPFAGAHIDVLSASHLVVCKAVFDRPKDWVDIDAMLEQHAPVDVAEVLRWVGRIAGDTDARYDRIAAVLTR